MSGRSVSTMLMNVLPSTAAQVVSVPGGKPDFVNTSSAWRAFSVPGASRLITTYFISLPPCVRSPNSLLLFGPLSPQPESNPSMTSPTDPRQVSWRGALQDRRGSYAKDQNRLPWAHRPDCYRRPGVGSPGERRLALTTQLPHRRPSLRR